MSVLFSTCQACGRSEALEPVTIQNKQAMLCQKCLNKVMLLNITAAITAVHEDIKGVIKRNDEKEKEEIIAKNYLSLNQIITLGKNLGLAQEQAMEIKGEKIPGFSLSNEGGILADNILCPYCGCVLNIDIPEKENKIDCECCGKSIRVRVFLIIERAEI